MTTGGAARFASSGSAPSQNGPHYTALSTVKMNGPNASVPLRVPARGGSAGSVRKRLSLSVMVSFLRLRPPPALPPLSGFAGGVGGRR